MTEKENGNNEKTTDDLKADIAALKEQLNIQAPAVNRQALVGKLTKRFSNACTEENAPLEIILEALGVLQSQIIESYVEKTAKLMREQIVNLQSDVTALVVATKPQDVSDEGNAGD